MSQFAGPGPVSPPRLPAPPPPATFPPGSWPSPVPPALRPRSLTRLWVGLAGGLALVLFACCVGGVAWFGLRDRNPDRIIAPGPNFSADGALQIGVDLPFQGPLGPFAEDTFRAMELVLQAQGGKAG